VLQEHFEVALIVTAYLTMTKGNTLQLDLKLVTFLLSNQHSTLSKVFVYVCTLQIFIGDAYYTCSCVRYVTRKHPQNDPPTSDNRWLIIGISVGCGILLIVILIVLIIIMVVCCRRRNEPRNGPTELDNCHSVNNVTSGTDARRNEYDTTEYLDNNYYSTIPDDNEYCKPHVSPHGNENNAYSALDLPELPKRLPKPNEGYLEPTVGLTEPSKDSSPYYLAVC